MGDRPLMLTQSLTPSPQSEPESQYIRDLRRRPRAPGAASFDLARSIAGRVEIHLLNGNWEAAQLAIDSGLVAHQTELLERAQRRRRTTAQWLQAPLADLDLPLRDHNALENVGCETVGQAIDFINSGREIENFSTVTLERFWQFCSAVGLGDLRTLTAAEFAVRHAQHIKLRQQEKDRRERDLTNATKYNRKRKQIMAERVAAGGLGGRKAFVRGPEQFYKGKESA